MFDILKIHEEVFDLLQTYHEEDPKFLYTFRRSNRGDKLAQGYWFYGNEEYLAVSFWSGIDWKNRTPNIIFVILNTGKTYLEINVSDSPRKRAFVNEFLISSLFLEADQHRYRRIYSQEGEAYLESLKKFIKSDHLYEPISDKEKIDYIITQHSTDFFKNKEEGIGLITAEDFKEYKGKVEVFRGIHRNENQLYEHDDKPSKLSYARIQNYGPIVDIVIDRIPFNTQWIFLTGENGTGKTSILRSMATAICFRKVTADEMVPGKKFQVDMELYNQYERPTPIFHRVDNKISGTRYLLVRGFAAYGQSRLRTIHSGLKAKKLKNAEPGISNISSLFNEDSFLYDIQREIENWKGDKSTVHLFEKRRQYIIELLTEVIPNLNNIIFDDVIGGIPVTSYLESDNNGNELRKVTFDRLSSGLKSLVAMIGDIVVRLYRQQPHEHDPSKFTGIIIIDEIDVHLHPRLQKILVEQLTEAFPAIQFIVTTHSPIPLLGAPLNSIFLNVHRDQERGVVIERLNINITNLLPNSLLSSPIFDFKKLTSINHKKGQEKIRTEDYFDQIIQNDELKLKIKDIAKKLDQE